MVVFMKSKLKKHIYENNSKNFFYNKTSNINRFKDKLGELGGNLAYNLILVFIAACVVVYVLNIVVANQIIYRIRNESIDYELFREMKISDDLIEEVVISDHDDYDMLTLYMMVHNYDTSKYKKINNANADLVLRSITYDENFREIRDNYVTIFKNIKAFPVLQTSNGDFNVSFADTWNAYRGYGGDRRHEGADLMAKENVSGKLKVISMTEGTIEQKGWLEQGGYRLGIRSDSGAYFYYAHLDSYRDNLNVGDFVEAGEFIGFMGDSGYGPEGTTGQFDVHLHLGIYIDSKNGQISVNPYPIINYLQKMATVPELSMTNKKS